MSSILAAIFVSLAKAFPTVFSFIASAIQGGTMPTEAEVEAHIDAIEVQSPKLDKEEDEAAGNKK
jgi:hypothetical protein